MHEHSGSLIGEPVLQKRGFFNGHKGKMDRQKTLKKDTKCVATIIEFNIILLFISIIKQHTVHKRAVFGSKASPAIGPA